MNPDAGSRERTTFSPVARRFLALALVLGLSVTGMVLWQKVTMPGNAFEAMATGHYELASRYYATAANAGDSMAQNSLGNLYYLGMGVPQDFAKAADLYFSAASNNHAAAQLNLANLFRQGLGVKTDPMRAFGWYRMSDINGNPRAEYYMTQISLEFTLSPLQITTARETYAKLDALLAAGL